jgi:hypothetical protein
MQVDWHILTVAKHPEMADNQTFVPASLILNTMREL